MRSILNYTFLLLFFRLTVAGSLYAQSPKFIQWTPQGISIHLKDNLQHPQFSWPLSTLHYQVDFGPNGIEANELALVDGSSGKNIPFQLNEPELKGNRIQKATLTFQSDLPSGDDKTFQLLLKNNDTQSFPEAVKVEKSAGSYIISNGKIRIEIPSQETKSSAPIKRYGNAKNWLGYGEIPATLSLIKMTVTELNTGPVEAIYKIDYKFNGNKNYSVKLTLTSGMEFVVMDEEMTGFTLKDEAAWRMIWNGIKPAYRYASTRASKIDSKQKGYKNILWEPMEGLPVTPGSEKHPDLSFDQKNGKDGKLPFRITPYDNWMTWWRLPTAAFWSEKENTTIGLFIKDMEKWNDGLYALWGSKDNLSIFFHWKNNRLDYTFPLVSGTRSVAISAYGHQKDINLVNDTNNSLVYIDYLRRWYGWIGLDKVKSWILDYDTPETGYPKYFKPENAPSNLTLSSLENQLSGNLKSIATGNERISGPTPVGSRVYYDFIAPSFDLNAGKMSPAQYRKLRAWFLFVGYLYMDETLMPMRTMLSGHPNFLSDVKGVTGLTAFLFPRHPEASKMADHFEKFIHLNYNYHIRPAVPSWESKGGRWTENLATYTWAALKPTIRTSYLLHHSYDGKNRLLQPGVSMYGDWLLNAISSPLISKNNRRVYPPQGAHAHAYGDGPPNALRLLGQELVYYDPLLSENIFWITTAEDSPFESNKEKDKAWREMLKGEWETNKGTNPHLKSAKYTGYGVVLRSGFGTKDEMYVNLQQIDEGPNYRWGRAAMGGNGVIYYYAQGKRYSHNGSEDVGDGPFGDVERITNFGIKKAGGYRAIGPYRSVGRNDLTEPLYDFDFAQFASIKANKDIAADYRSRSVLQSNADYIAVFDEVPNENTEGRFSWFVGIEDDFPAIHQVTPGVSFKDADIKPSQSNYHKDPAVLPTKGRYYDGKGSFLTVVTHKPEIKVRKAAFGCIVAHGNNTDLIFRTGKNIQYQKNGIVFTGTIGIVQKKEQEYAAALFAGSNIGIPGIKVQLNSGSKAAISLQTYASGFKGKFQSRHAEQIVFTTTKEKLIFYLDGIAVHGKSTTPKNIQLTIPAGKHTWQWTDNGVIPQASEIISTKVKSEGVTLNWKTVPGALSYQLQLSKDGGSNWNTVKDDIKTTSETLSGLINDTKIHLRILAKAKGGTGEPSADYPVYVTNKVPHAPEGLLLDMNGSQTKITWGKILGSNTYRLYRRPKNSLEPAFKAVYTGAESSFMDKKPSADIIYEYVVTALNGNGESERSNAVNTDMNSFLNWEPMKGEGFRRDTENHENGFLEFNVLEEVKSHILTYPIK